MNLVNYLIAQRGVPLPPIKAALYEYVLAGNGLFIRGTRREFDVQFCIMPLVVRGLPDLEPALELHVPAVSRLMLADMIRQARTARNAHGEPCEILFHLQWDETDRWRLATPPQMQEPARVKPTDDSPSSSYAGACIEVHSHVDVGTRIAHPLRHRQCLGAVPADAQFSSLDDADELGFRIYAVLGCLAMIPTIRTRVGLYGYYYDIPARWLFDLPPDMGDAVTGEGTLLGPAERGNEMAGTRTRKRKTLIADFDLTHLSAAPLKVTLPEHRNALKLYLVGCGGTGSWLAAHLVRLARFLQHGRHLHVQITFVDPDVVEMKNVFRQNFGEAEVGGLKAELLALRYAAAWGMSIQVQPARFDKAMVQLDLGDLGVIIGCVDNAAARQSIADTLVQEAGNRSAEALPRLWWLDSGNGLDTGQVLLGAALSVRQLRYAFPYWPEVGFCTNLPAPSLQHPDLLQTRLDPEPATASPGQSVRGAPTASCAEMALSGDQSLSINAMMANIAATYLWHLFADPKGLTMFATYCNLGVLSTRSRFITPEQVAGAAGSRKGQRIFKPKPHRRRSAS